MAIVTFDDQAFKKYQDMVNGLDPPRLTLNQWEERFVASVASRLTHQGVLSERQCEVLKKIYEEKGNG